MLRSSIFRAGGGVGVVTSRRYRLATPVVHEEASSLHRASFYLVMAVYLQMVLGAIVRHYQGSLWIVHLGLGALLMFASLWIMMLTILHPPLRRTLGSAVAVLGEDWRRRSRWVLLRCF